MHKLESIPDNETHKILWDFEIQTDHVIPAKRPDPVNINQKKKKKKKKKERELPKIDFTVPVDEVKIKENEKSVKYSDLARELEKLWNMKVMVIPTVIGALRIVSIQTSALLRSS